jgi:polyhydroxyalkanoate synthesis regulator phasin
MSEISAVFKMFLEAGDKQLTRLAGQLLSNEVFVSAMQGAVARAADAKLVLDNQLRAALSRLGVPAQGELDALREEVRALSAEVQRLREEMEHLRPEVAAQASRTKPSLALAPEQPEKHYSEVSMG